MGHCDCGEENGGAPRVDILRPDMECGRAHITSLVRGTPSTGGGARSYLLTIMVLYRHLYFYKAPNGVSKSEEFLYALFIRAGNHRSGFG